MKFVPFVRPNAGQEDLPKKNTCVLLSEKLVQEQTRNQFQFRSIPFGQFQFHIGMINSISKLNKSKFIDSNSKFLNKQFEELTPYLSKIFINQVVGTYNI